MNINRAVQMPGFAIQGEIEGQAQSSCFGFPFLKRLSIKPSDPGVNGVPMAVIAEKPSARAIYVLKPRNLNLWGPGMRENYGPAQNKGSK